MVFARLYLSPPCHLAQLVADLKRLFSDSGDIFSRIWFTVLGGVALSF